MIRLAVVFAVLAAAAAPAAAWAAAAQATGPSAPTTYLTWPGKTGGPAEPNTAGRPAAIALPKAFFPAGGDDMAGAPAPLMPRPVPGGAAVTNASTVNTASNRARQNELLTADSASDGPVAGAEAPN
jgi:hypothetical protein